MLWDSIYFYFGAVMEEPDIWGTLIKKDDIIYYDNDFEIFIDPDGDTHLYYELEINALNTIWDLLLIKPYRDGGPAVDSWNIDGLKTEININGTLNNPNDRDSNWTVEAAIPWEVLHECAGVNTPPIDGDVWRINFSRVEWRTSIHDGKYVKAKDELTEKFLPENNWVWSPQGLINMHYPEMWGYVLFAEKTTLEKFEIPKSSTYKWLLRQVYYKEKTFYSSDGKYSVNLEELGLEHLLDPHDELTIKIETTENCFEAAVYFRSEKLFTIFCDGKIN